MTTTPNEELRVERQTVSTLTVACESDGVAAQRCPARSLVVPRVGPDEEDQALFASTDTGQHAEEVVRYCRLRCQIEPMVQDAEQHAGLTHCQARSSEKIGFHSNMSVTTVHLPRLPARKAMCSPRTYRRGAHNRLLIGLLLFNLGPGAEYA